MNGSLYANYAIDSLSFPVTVGLGLVRNREYKQDANLSVRAPGSSSEVKPKLGNAGITL